MRYVTLCKGRKNKFFNKKLLSIPEQIYIILNVSVQSYPDNSLAQFKNYLPNYLSFENDNIQVSLELIGFSSNFRNLFVPGDKIIPSVIVTNNGLVGGSVCPLKLETNKYVARRCMRKYDFKFDDIEREIKNVHFREYFLEDRWYTEENLITFCNKNNENNLVGWEYNCNGVIPSFTT